MVLLLAYALNKNKKNQLKGSNTIGPGAAIAYFETAMIIPMIIYLIILVFAVSKSVQCTEGKDAVEIGLNIGAAFLFPLFYLFFYYAYGQNNYCKGTSIGY